MTLGEQDCLLGLLLELGASLVDREVLGAPGLPLVAEIGRSGIVVLKFGGVSSEKPGIAAGCQGRDFTVGEVPREGAEFLEGIEVALLTEEERPGGPELLWLEFGVEGLLVGVEGLDDGLDAGTETFGAVTVAFDTGAVALDAGSVGLAVGVEGLDAAGADLDAGTIGLDVGVEGLDAVAPDRDMGTIDLEAGIVDLEVGVEGRDEARAGTVEGVDLLLVLFIELFDPEEVVIWREIKPFLEATDVVSI